MGTYKYEAVYNKKKGAGPVGYYGFVDSNGRIVESPLRELNGSLLEDAFPSSDGWAVYCYNHDGEEVNLPF